MQDKSGIYRFAAADGVMDITNPGALHCFIFLSITQSIRSFVNHKKYRKRINQAHKFDLKREALVLCLAHLIGGDAKQLFGHKGVNLIKRTNFSIENTSLLHRFGYNRIEMVMPFRMAAALSGQRPYNACSG